MRRLAKDIRAEKFRTGKEPVTGMTVLNGKPVILSLAPVTTSDGSAPTNGYFVFVKYISRDFIQYIEQALQLKIDLDVSQLKQRNGLTAGWQSAPFRFEKTSRTVTAYSRINDLLGANQIILKIVSNRRNYQDGMLVVKYFGVAFLIILILLAGVCALTVDRLITHRISLLHTFVSKVADSSDTSAEIHIPGNDEIAMLGRNMNSMLHRLNGSYAELRIREERFRLIMEATNDGYFDMNLANNMIYISPSWLACIGYPDSDGRVGFEEHISHIYPEDLELFQKARTKYLNGETDQLRLEYRILKGNGEPVWTTIRGKAAECDENGRPTRIIGMISDITGRKKYEEENHYLLQMDTTTDLKNRTYMENLLRNMEQRGESGGSLIIGDVNGLKLMNDTFGHQEGDRLLGTIGGILRRCCGEEAIPSRWGGDEFLILVVDRDEAYVEDLIQRIRDVCERAENFPIRISIAWGWAQWDENHSRTDDLLKLAEERMYRNKLLESRSARSAIIASLKQSLHEKHIETVEHTKRIQQMCMKVGAYLGMSQEELDELALLAILHDIGKIAIPEDYEPLTHLPTLL
jgi:diguanylate cyclase (GGDEF)-like protein/PAS domain S-box-containing protein